LNIQPDDGPKFPFWADTYLIGWRALQYDRSYTQGGLGRIWYASMSRYARDAGIEGDEFAEFITFVTALDDEYLDHVQQQLESASKGKKP